jgi:F0F1-type ATP synthase assembly protein I
MLSSVAQGVRILLWQLAGIVLLVAVAWFFDGRVARSLLVGGGIGLLATSYLVFVLIKHGLQPTRPATVLGLFANWFVKTLLVLGLLAIAMRYRTLLPAGILLGLAASLMLYWLAVMTRPAATSGQERDKTNG